MSTKWKKQMQVADGVFRLYGSRVELECEPYYIAFHVDYNTYTQKFELSSSDSDYYECNTLSELASYIGCNPTDADSIRKMFI